MKALRFYGKSDLRVEDVGAPKIVVRNRSSSKLSAAEFAEQIYTNMSRDQSSCRINRSLGHEFSGIVVEVGSGVVKYHPGDRVAIQPKVFVAADR
jgi:threonine dehydrogenase-like Zn-dependent dehydrogenase